MDKKFNTYASYEEEPFALHNLSEYVRRNLVGILGLLFVCAIVYWVDYVSRLNSLAFGLPSPVSMGAPMQIASAPFKKVRKRR